MIDKVSRTDFHLLTCSCPTAPVHKDLLSDLGALAPLIASLGGEQAIAEIARAILDVARRWP